MASAADIAETNKVRAALGLPLLAVPGAPPPGPVFKAAKDPNDSDGSEEASTLETREAAGFGNWQKLQAEKDAKKAREEKKAAIRKAREAAQRNTILEGKGLGDDDDAGDLDTRSWLLGQKKRQKKVESQREADRLQDEARKLKERRDYTAADLAGVKVAHDVGDFDLDGGEEQVLVLKDATIDENEEEGDELENQTLVEQDRLKDKLRLKKKKPVYDPNELHEDGGVLQQYDETIDGKKRKHMTLDVSGRFDGEREAKKQNLGAINGRVAISLDILDEPVASSDYQQAKEVKIKKPKKKKTSRRKEHDEEEGDLNGSRPANGEDMQLDTIADQSTARHTTTNSIVDDEDLHASLARQRREALKDRKRLKPEELARQIREAGTTVKEEEQEDGGLVIDEISEFVTNLQGPGEREPERRKIKTEPEPLSLDTIPTANGDVEMRDSDDSEDEEQTVVKREASPVNASTGLDEEDQVTQGLGATLNLLTSRGILQKSDTDHAASLRAQNEFLTKKRALEAQAEQKARLQRERDRASGKLDRMSAREREERAAYENKMRDQEESRRQAEHFNREYKPEVTLRYTDEFGRAMNQKEAFKHLSHQFHGKGSGKQKTEKYLKKIEEEKKRMERSNLDAGGSGGGLGVAAGAVGKKRGEIGVRLA